MTILEKVSAQKLVMVALLLLMVYPLAIIAARLEIWHFRNSFLLFIVAALVGFGVFAMSLLKLSKGEKADSNALLVALGAAVLPLAIMGSHVYKAQSSPFIHDISTDLIHAPQLKAAAQVRLKSDHGVEYLASQVSKKQKAGYPELTSLTLSQDPQTVFAAAKQIMVAQGWAMMAENNHELPYTLEASDTSLLFGFTDDVVLRIQLADSGSLVDMRSMSRVGQSDMGKNAQRIGEFFNELTLALK